MTADEVETGPIAGSGPAPGAWTIVSGKNEGITPGFTIADARGDVYFVKFDPPSNPGDGDRRRGDLDAVLPRPRLSRAGELHRDAPSRRPADRRRRDHQGRPTAATRPFVASDLESVLAKAARQDDGTYRVVASKALPGTPLGPFRYHGTRPDDPNDIYDHEHRRELRGLRVFAAWLNHDDSRSINTLDTLVEHEGRRIVRHHLIDFGSTLGSGSTAAQKPRAGNEYIWEARPTFITMLTFGLYVRPWIKVKYPDLPVRRPLRGGVLHPGALEAGVPERAFDNMRADDAFWAARLLAAFDDDLIRAAVKSGQFSDPEADAYLAQTLITRKDKILQHWLNGVLPLVDFELSREGTLTFTNVAVDAVAAQPATRVPRAVVRLRQPRGHRDARRRRGLRSRSCAPRRLRALLRTAPEYVMVELRGIHDRHPGWASPLKVYFRRQPQRAWQLVGVERQP